MIRTQSSRDRILDGATIVIIVVVLVVAFQPGSAVRSIWTGYRAKHATEVILTKLWDSTAKLSARLDVAAGAPDVMEISDYECPFCRKMSPAVDSAVAAGLKIGYLNFPLPIHAHAMGAALSALCADEQGGFRSLHAQLMSTSQWLKDTAFVREARTSGISDSARFRRCLVAPTTRELLDRQMAFAKTIGAHATPTFVSRRAVHNGGMSMAALMSFATDNK